MSKPSPRTGRISRRQPAYRIPALWDCWRESAAPSAEGQVVIEPARYLAECLRWIQAHASVRGRITGRSISRILGARRAGKLRVRADGRVRRAGDWIRTASMYGMMVRCATAWDHDGNKRLTTAPVNELGTFLKSILLLPHLRRMGINVLYLLPVVKASRIYRKGELGCPYAARNFFELDPDQYDAAFGPEYGDLNAQFRLFVASAHRLGMRVMLDIAPRTAARDCDWILDHPEWFYWIDRRFERTYAAPRVPGVTYLNPDPEKMDEIYNVPAVREHLRKFRFAPNVTHPQKWRNFAAAQKRRPAPNLLAEIARHFGVITPPGFSDVVNDTQPPWSDVTYLRLFEDHPTAALPHLGDPQRQPPYVLYDTAKASMFPGRRPQTRLWAALANILPHYQRFGVDGARVDMAHALPHRLEAMILDRPRRVDPDFCLLAEQLGTENHAAAFRSGYNIIIGPSWWMQPRGHEGRMHEFMRRIPNLQVPVMAAAETPDTPRAVVRRGKRRFAMQALVVNNFLPNAVPMLNGGMEVFERQPMNLGLDSSPSDRYVLPRSDPFYGKLAFFDRYALHWTNAGSTRMVELAGRCAQVRSSYLAELTSRRAYFAPTLLQNARRIVATGFHLSRGQGCLIMLANLDYDHTRRTTLVNLPRPASYADVLYSIGQDIVARVRGGRVIVELPAGEAIVLRVH